MNEQIFTVMEFSGRGDAMFGGSAADWSLYTQEDGSEAFISAADAHQGARKIGHDRKPPTCWRRLAPTRWQATEPIRAWLLISGCRRRSDEKQRPAPKR